MGWIVQLLLATFVWTIGVTSSFCLTQDERNTIDVYKRASRSVVHIRSVVVRYGSFLRPLPVEGMGSGIVIDKKGHIVTNAHVIENARTIQVTLMDGTEWKAKLVGRLPKVDLALLKIDAPPEALWPIELGRSRDLRVGQKVLAIGNPFGFKQTLTQGVISFLGRSITAADGTELKGLIQTDAAINPGNSGGPLLDDQGRLIGINTAIVSPSGGSVGVGFAIPVDQLRKHLPRLANRSSTRWLNVTLALVGILVFLKVWRGIARKGRRDYIPIQIQKGGPRDEAP